MSQLFDELKRRNVFRVAVAYVVTSWLVLQVADVVLGNIDAPPWVFSVFLLALTLGFFPVLFFSWAYELTPEGLKKESEVDRSSSITPQTGRKLDLVTIIMLVAVVAFVLIERTMFSEPEETIAGSGDSGGLPAGEVTVTAVDDQSIAVLAFEDLSQAGDQAFFAEGLSEELLNVLAQVPDLKVAGRTSSFAFKGKDTDLREIGEILNVAHILEGSVRKAGNRIRVTAQLIKASDGFHLFSETYDRDLDDIFAVQDEIAELISNSLRMELTGERQLPQVTPTDLAAFDLYLIARQRIRSRNPELMYEAMDMLDEALEIDPDYAPAIAQRALAVFLLSDAPGAYGDIPEEDARAEAHRLLDRALSVDPGLAEAHAVLGLVLTQNVGNDDEAIASLHRALEINPNLESAKLWLANAVSDVEESNALYEDVILRDPMYTPAFNNLIQNYMGFGRFDDVVPLIDRVERVTGQDNAIHQARGTVGFMTGELADAARHLQVVFDANPNSTVMQMWRGYTLIQLGEMEDAIENNRIELALVAHRELGNIEAADNIVEGLDFQLGDRQRRIRHTADYLAALGRHDEMVEKIEDTWGSVERLLAEIPLTNTWGSEYLGPLAYVYLLAGREAEFGLLIDHLRLTLDNARDIGIDNWYHWYSQGQYAALTGDAESAAEHLQRAIDMGYASVIFIEPLWNLVRESDAIIKLEATALAGANDERAKLGLDPYRPIAATN